MDAVKYLAELKRLCNQYKGCHGCPFEQDEIMCKTPSGLKELEKMVKTVEEWSKEHPAKTRQSEFLKMFPGAKIGTEGFLVICPVLVDSEVKCSYECSLCRKDYWLAEVE